MHDGLKVDGSRVLEICNVAKSFGENKVLRDISLTVSKGDVVSVIGPSGSGKSTLLRCATLLDRFDSGTLRYGDLTVMENGVYAPKAVLHEVRGRFGLVFQNFNLFPHLSALENITLSLRLVQGKGREEAETIASSLLARMGLAGREKAYPCELSGGQQQRVSIGRALMNAPSVVLADEPTGNLDSKNSQEIVELLRSSNLKYNQTLIVITHDESIALQADRIIAIEDGRITRDERIRGGRK